MYVFLKSQGMMGYLGGMDIRTTTTWYVKMHLLELLSQKSTYKPLFYMKTIATITSRKECTIEIPYFPGNGYHNPECICSKWFFFADYQIMKIRKENLLTYITSFSFFTWNVHKMHTNFYTHECTTIKSIHCIFQQLL